jgi:hypothetical protein
MTLMCTVLALLALQDKPKPDPIAKERTSLLRHSLKPHAAFLGIDKVGGEALLRMEDGTTRAWPIDPGAEIRIRGFWGAVEDLTEGERVWVWARTDRDGKVRGVIMIADELSEQDIHQIPWTLVSHEAGSLVIRRKLDAKTEQTRTLKVPAGVTVPAATTVYVQTKGDEAVRVATAEELATLKEAQKARLEAQWRKTGLPGTITGLHLLSGEIEVTLDHESMRWGRSLKPGDAVTINLDKPVQASVLDVRPWYERTRVTLVSIGRDLADAVTGRRIRVSIQEPPAELLKSPIPLDAGRPREPSARAEWMLASTYCSCSIAGDVCTGMFYTLAACNTMTCAMPNRVRTFVKPLFEKGLTDKEVFGQLEKEFGPSLWKPHLLR